MDAQFLETGATERVPIDPAPIERRDMRVEHAVGEPHRSIQDVVASEEIALS